MEKPLRVIIVEEHQIVQEALGLLIRVIPQTLLAGSATSYAEAYILCRALQPDAVLINIDEPNSEGLDCIRMLRTIAPRMKIVVMTGLGWNVAMQREAQLLGADYFLHKLASPQAVENVMKKIRDAGKTTYQRQDS